MSPRLVGVLRTERLTDDMVRVVFGGDLGDFAVGAFTDHYVNIQFPPPGAPYIQHNPNAPDGKEGFVEFVSAFVSQTPELNLDIRRIVAEDDIVVAHSLLTVVAGDRGTVVVDIFRLEDNKIVEHWDVTQPFPETSANDHPMF